ncbi:MAG TPA: tetratricopeptide repeat protein [Candidatus Aquilonibacter sp.]|nr:tetratricopeptide repeat protein [Candidatus Aquilonibacter sp.]
MRFRAWLLAFVLAPLTAYGAESISVPPSVPPQQPAPLTSADERAALHNSPDWALIAPHLPDPQTASAAELEMAGDVLRARRFPEDALDYYGYAMRRGGDVSTLLNKMGIVRLELHQLDLAHAMFLRTVRAHKNNSIAWNNLGVTDYAMEDYRGAIDAYRHAVKLNKNSAVFHSNLGLAYFEKNDSDDAIREFARALRLDPSIMSGADNGGTTAHVIGSHNYSGMCLEMAKLFARQHDADRMLYWLAKATDAGLNLREAIRSDTALIAYEKDPRVLLLIENERQMHSRSLAAAKPPSLGSSDSH